MFPSKQPHNQAGQKRKSGERMAQLRPRTPVASVSDVGALGSAGAGIFANESERSLGAGDARSGLASDGVTLGHLAALGVLGVGHQTAAQGHVGE